MKYAVQTFLVLETPSQQTQLMANILTRIGNKPIWGIANIAKGLDMDGKPQCSVEVRFNQKVDMDDLYSFIKSRMNAIPVLKGTVSIHNCSHDEDNRPCVIEQIFIK